ncbi:MAG: integrase, partial [Bacteroidota bacterium]
QLMVASINQEATDLISIPWERIINETASDPVLCELESVITAGFEGDYPNISQYLRYKESLYTQDGVIMYCDRVVVPPALRQSVLKSLHAAHQGTSSMMLRAQAIVFWPGMTKDIQEIRAKCHECNRNAPSQAELPSTPANPPSTPFEEIFSDFFEFAGRNYLVTGDRLSGWVEIFSTPCGSAQSGARGLVKCLRQWFSTFGVPCELTSDGGPEFTAELTSQFLKTWGVKHRVSSAYYPKGNGRAEVAVKTAKRLMRANVGPGGTLNNDKFLREILQLRNTPDADCGVSPAEIVFGRPMRDNLLFTSRLLKQSFSKRWKQAWSAKEEALRARFIRTSEKINLHSKQLPPLPCGTKCFIQNQHGPHRNKWHNTGTIMEALPFDQYTVKLDGSRRLKTRNRKFLRAYTPASVTTEPRPIAPDLGRCLTPFVPRSADQVVESGRIGDKTNSSSDESSDQITEAIITPDCNEVTKPQSHLTSGADSPVPRALARLRDFNAPGRKEGMQNPRRRQCTHSETL